MVVVPAIGQRVRVDKRPIRARGGSGCKGTYVRPSADFASFQSNASEGGGGGRKEWEGRGGRTIHVGGGRWGRRAGGGGVARMPAELLAAAAASGAVSVTALPTASSSAWSASYIPSDICTVGSKSNDQV